MARLSTPLTRRTALSLIGLGGSAALLAACQPAATSAPTTVPAAAPKPTEAAKPAAQPTTAPAARPTDPPKPVAQPTTAPAQAQPSTTRMRIDEQSDVTSLNPLATNATPSRRRALQIFSGLYQYDTRNQIVPDLAESQPQTPDPRTYIVKLRPNVKFHSGKSLTAEDVKFSYEQLLKPDYGSIWRGAIEPVVESVTARDASTVEFKLKRPFGPMLAKLALIPIVSSEQSKDDLTLKPDGTGPFKMVSYQKGSVLELARHQAYHWPGQPRLAQLQINVVPENAGRLANLANGISHLAPEPSFQDLQLMRSRGIVVSSVAAPASTYGYLNFKRADGPMANKDLRRALAYALDRSMVVQNIWAGEGLPGQVFFRPELWVFDPSYKPWSEKPDLARAREHLQKSGRGGDSIVITTSSDEALQGTAVILQASAKAAGMNVEVAQVERAAFTAELQKDSWDVILTDTYTGSNSGLEADAIISLLRTGGSANFGRFSNSDMDRAIEAAVFADSREAALPHYRRVMEIDAEEVPVLTVAYHNYVEALNPKVRNYQTIPLAHYDLRTLEIG